MPRHGALFAVSIVGATPLPKVLASRVPEKAMAIVEPVFLTALLLVCGGFAYLGTHPMVTCPPEYEAQFTPELRQSLEAHTKGIYSPNLPSPGYLAAVECIEDGCVRFRTHYLFLGSTVNELGPDGFDLIKPLGKQ